MPITAIDPNPALIVIDLQKGVVGFPTAHPIGDIINQTRRLADAFRERGLPVVLVNVTGLKQRRTDSGSPSFSPPPDWTEFVPELGQQSSDFVVSKQTWGAFIGTSLDEYLRERGVTQIVLTGVATSIGVESTARSAFDHGYTVTLVVDAMTDLELAAHLNSVEKIFPRLGETGDTDDVLQLLSL